MEQKIMQEELFDTTEQMDIGHLVKIISERLKAWGSKTMKEHNLTFAQVETLNFLHKNGECASQKEIEKFLKVSHPTVVGIITRLEKNGFVTTHQDDKDRRNKLVCTTEKALNTRDMVAAGKVHAEEKLCNGLTDEEVAELKRLLTKVYSNLD